MFAQVSHTRAPVRSPGPRVPYHWRMAEFPGDPDASFPPRPLPATYWVVPGRLLVGEHPGSQSRADAVRTYLTAHGVPAERVRSEGMGEGQPIADNGTAEGRANNRRVELILENAKPTGSAAQP